MNRLEEIELGMKLLANNFTLENIFDKTKKITELYIPDKSMEALKKADSCSIEVGGNKICSIQFCFGESWYQYEVFFNGAFFKIRQQEGHNSFSKEIIDIDTYKLLRFISDKEFFDIKVD